jgi:hypothetical protein
MLNSKKMKLIVQIYAIANDCRPIRLQLIHNALLSELLQSGLELFDNNIGICR